MRALIKNTAESYTALIKINEFNFIIDFKLKRRYDHIKVSERYQLQKLLNPKMPFISNYYYLN